MSGSFAACCCFRVDRCLQPVEQLIMQMCKDGSTSQIFCGVGLADYQGGSWFW